VSRSDSKPHHNVSHARNEIQRHADISRIIFMRPLAGSSVYVIHPCMCSCIRLSVCMSIRDVSTVSLVWYALMDFHQTFVSNASREWTKMNWLGFEVKGSRSWSQHDRICQKYHFLVCFCNTCDMQQEIFFKICH